MPQAQAPTPTRQQVIDRARALAPGFAKRAAAAEDLRRMPPESVREMLDAGLCRILMPPRFGGYGLDFDTWYDVMLEISKADASHGWCASLLIHHAHLIAQFPEEMQRAMWADGPDVPIAASFAPRVQVTRVDGGYRVSGRDSTFASGVDHSTWVMVGGLWHDGPAPEWLLFMIPPGEFSIRDSWHTAGMRGTGSNTIVTDNVFVPDSRVLSLTDLRLGKGPGGAIHAGPIYRTLFFFYAPLCFAAPMLGAALGAYEQFREGAKTRRSVDGSLVAEKTSLQVGMARASADLDAAELLLRRAAQAHHAPEADWPRLLSRSIRDFARVSELSVAAIDTLLALSGSAGFSTSQPIQRAWRDIHFAASHISVNTEANYSHFGRMELGLGRDPNRPFF
jgi:3-hydroxy-9,10-secoandrosta-1,3,5(10)-triene-9,17-dione monooxygenase